MAEKRTDFKSVSDTKSTSNNEPRITIDHRFFPHIIDIILASLSYPGLVACASACKEWRGRLRSRLFKHVAVFESTLNDETTVIRSRDPSWPDKSAVLVVSDPANVHDFREVYHSSIVDSYWSYEGFELSQILGPTSRWPTVFHRLVVPATSYGIGDFGHDPNPSESQSFSSRHVNWSDIVHFIDYSEGNYALSPHRRPARATSSAIISIACYSDPTALDAPVRVLELESICEKSKSCTFVFTNCIKQKSRQSFRYTNAGRPPFVGPLKVGATPGDWRIPNHTYGAAVEVVLTLLRRQAVESIIVVGLEDFVVAEFYVAYVRDVCFEAAFSMGLGVVWNEQVPTLGELLKFYTHAQYRDLVGEERYRLVTVH